MTKQENEKTFYGSLITSTKCYNCIHFHLCFAQKGGANLELASDCCYYQSKPPEDSIVLSKKEYERITKELVTEQRATEIAKEYFEKMRKETAEKIYTKIKDSFLMDSDSRYKLKLWLKEEFGVDIYE